VRKTLLAVLTLLALPGALCAQTATVQKYGFSPEAFDIRYYIQPRWAYYSEPMDLYDAKLAPETDNTFSIRRSRIMLISNISPSVVGRVQFDVKPDKFETMDAYFAWNPVMSEKKPLTLTVGQFKKPISYQEFVMSSSNLNLIDRPFTNDFLEKKLFVAAEDIGAMATADLWEVGVPVTVNAGVFNGLLKDSSKYDLNSGKEFVGRIEATPVTGISLGVNGTISQRGYASDSTQTDNYNVWGGDVVLARSNVQIVAEIFGGDNTEAITGEPPVLPVVPTFQAWYAEAIYRARGGWEPAVRFESFDPDTDVDDDARTILTGQIAYSFSPNFRWQVNVAREDFEASAIEDLTAVVSQWTVRL
jgi:hypothetical protein